MKGEWQKRSKSKSCYDWAKANGYSSFVSLLLSGRYSDVEVMKSALNADLKLLDMPDGLPDIEQASRRIAMAVLTGETICIETDHDADGVTSHAVIMESLTRIFGHPSEKIRSYIGHRLIDGYGLSDNVANRIIKENPTPCVVITADNGSSDEPRIKRLSDLGFQVIVTDHHEIPADGIPKSAFAVISPAREDSQYPDPLIAGCMVAWLTMLSVRKCLISMGHFNGAQVASMTTVMDYVALGTVADCVSMSRSKNNRLIVAHGLNMINKGIRPCWRALKPYLGDPAKLVTSEDLGFAIGPRINARGRLDEAMLGVQFLLSVDDAKANELAAVLDAENNERKLIERTLKASAMKFASEYVEQGYQSLVIFLEEGHPGVHGIVSSRITEAYGRPSIIISPKQGDENIVSASARGVPGFHVRQALQDVSDSNPGLLSKFGGHKGAAGMSFDRSNIEKFRHEFELAALKQIKTNAIHIGPVVFNDGVLPADFISLETMAEYSKIEPFGREMDSPVFECQLTVIDKKRIGEKKNHLSMMFDAAGKKVKGVWFNLDENLSDDDLGIEIGEQKTFLFSLSKNTFRGESSVQLMICDVKN